MEKIKQGVSGAVKYKFKLQSRRKYGEGVSKLKDCDRRIKKQEVDSVTVLETGGAGRRPSGGRSR